VEAAKSFESELTRKCANAQVDDTDVIAFLLSTEIIPLCLRTMEMGSELSKTVATFIVQKILLDNVRAARCRAGVRACVFRSGSPGARKTLLAKRRLVISMYTTWASHVEFVSPLCRAPPCRLSVPPLRTRQTRSADSARARAPGGPQLHLARPRSASSR